MASYLDASGWAQSAAGAGPTQQSTNIVRDGGTEGSVSMVQLPDGPSDPDAIRMMHVYSSHRCVRARGCAACKPGREWGGCWAPMLGIREAGQASPESSSGILQHMALHMVGISGRAAFKSHCITVPTGRISIISVYLAIHMPARIGMIAGFTPTSASSRCCLSDSCPVVACISCHVTVLPYFLCVIGSCFERSGLQMHPGIRAERYLYW
jgi:hypothetical protein